ncbi:MAG: hypothetical protein Q7T44_06190 [Parvibaculum sp.]|nr:hypothetical protein [Parvibaculum sp.]
MTARNEPFEPPTILTNVEYLIEIGAHAKVLAARADQNDANIGAALTLRDRLHQSGHDRERQTVELVRPVEFDDTAPSLTESRT